MSAAKVKLTTTHSQAKRCTYSQASGGKELASCKSQTHLPYLKSVINYLLKHCFDQVSAMLDRLYCSFDELAEKYSVYKIDTIGDGEQLFVVSARFFDWE